MKILVICYMGMNRSKYLANFLSEQGLYASCAGILAETKNLVTQDQIDQSDVLIFVMPRIQEKFLLNFQVKQQRIITLNVEDRLDLICPDKINPSPEEIQEIYSTKVYPELERQISDYLPSLIN